MLRDVNASEQRNNTIIAAGYAALVKVIINHRRRHRRRRCKVARLRTAQAVQYTKPLHRACERNSRKYSHLLAKRNGTKQTHT